MEWWGKESLYVRLFNCAGVGGVSSPEKNKAKNQSINQSIDSLRTESTFYQSINRSSERLAVWNSSPGFSLNADSSFMIRSRSCGSNKTTKFLASSASTTRSSPRNVVTAARHRGTPKHSALKWTFLRKTSNLSAFLEVSVKSPMAETLVGLEKKWKAHFATLPERTMMKTKCRRIDCSTAIKMDGRNCEGWRVKGERNISEQRVSLSNEWRIFDAMRMYQSEV